MRYNLVNWNKTRTQVIDGESVDAPATLVWNVGKNCLTYEAVLEAALAYLGYEVVEEREN